MEVRIYCESCNKGMLGEDYDQDFQRRVMEFMVYHSEHEYKHLAAHKRDKYDRQPKQPRYLVEYKKQ